MKRFLTYFLIIVITTIITSSCSDLQTNIPQKSTDLKIHNNGITAVDSPNFHGKLIRENNWSFDLCIQCHSSNYTGGITGSSCLTCHTNTDGPQACNTCHGNFNDPNLISPPRGINNDTLTTSKSVGAHINHLFGNNLAENVKCENCHNVPQTYNAEGHVDSELPAEINFKGLAISTIATNANYNFSIGSCSNTYCHGNFEFTKVNAKPENQYIYAEDNIVGLNKTVDWTKVDGTQAECGSCHDLPPRGHLGFEILPLSSCVVCHSSVVNKTGQIIDKTKHINGDVDLGL
ncbi:MAG: hypothetical protein CO128_01140 [Ignavibacteriales bacterium CG_4_9_14_3_um_filter_30_11]|nr:MAG: hypothetical protein CO128_01140 [Ignavibacteriales bacterium CG_4_9_14_3_um_filter_30_11]